MKIVVVEDQGMIRAMIMHHCRERLKCEAVAEATSGEEAVRLCREVQPDLVLLDLGLPDGDGLGRVDAIRTAAPRCKIIILSSRTDAYSLARIHRATVSGFVDKNEPSPEVLTKAIETVMNGRTWFSVVVEQTRAALRADPKAFTKLLSDREQEILCLIGQGLTNEQIAEEVHISANTIRNHRRNIMGKVGIHSTAELIRYAQENGFVRIGS
jgi:DNA-binding NarL/FixJ family response regulator